MFNRCWRQSLTGLGLGCLFLTTQAQSLTPKKYDEQALVRALLNSSLELSFGRKSVDVSTMLAYGESGVYEPIYFANIKKGSTNRQRTAMEREALLLSGLNGAKATDLLTELDETSRSLEYGIRFKDVNGAQYVISAKQDQKQSNVLKTAGTDLELNSSIGFTYRQPLMRGKGSIAVEIDKRVAELEWQITQWQYVQQIQKVIAEGLSGFWQVKTATEIADLRKQLADITRDMRDDARSRVDAGKLSRMALIQLDRDESTRKTEWIKSVQMRDELKLKLLSSMGITGEDFDVYEFSDEFHVSPQVENMMIDEALENWTPYRISKLKQQQGQLRLEFANNQSKPAADLIVSYGQSGYTDTSYSWSTAKSGKYPDWYVGVSVELGLWGERKATSQMVAQVHRMTQAETELEAIRVSFQNDWWSRKRASDRAVEELNFMKNEFDIRQKQYTVEKLRQTEGMGSNSAVLLAQQDMLEANIRWLDALGRAEATRISMLLAQGKLLSHYKVEQAVSTNFWE